MGSTLLGLALAVLISMIIDVQHINESLDFDTTDFLTPRPLRVKITEK
jgi:hypothetical protein